MKLKWHLFGQQRMLQPRKLLPKRVWLTLLDKLEFRDTRKDFLPLVSRAFPRQKKPNISKRRKEKKIRRNLALYSLKCSSQCSVCGPVHKNYYYFILCVIQKYMPIEKK